MKMKVEESFDWNWGQKKLIWREKSWSDVEILIETGGKRRILWQRQFEMKGRHWGEIAIVIGDLWQLLKHENQAVKHLVVKVGDDEDEVGVDIEGGEEDVEDDDGDAVQ